MGNNWTENIPGDGDAYCQTYWALQTGGLMRVYITYIDVTYA